MSDYKSSSDLEYGILLEQMNQHAAQYGCSSILSVPGVFEAMMDDPAWGNPVTAAAIAQAGEDEDDDEEFDPRLDPDEIPADFPVRPLDDDEEAQDRATCGTCGLSWDDAIVTQYTPAPSARCPFEQYHLSEDDDE